MSVTTFEYRALDKRGTRRAGVAHAQSEAEAFRKISAQGLTPVHIKPASTRKSAQASSVRIRTKQLAEFTYQLGVLIGARVPISEGLMSVAEQEKQPKIRAVITDVASRIEAGEQLADAMGKHQRAFGSVYLETVRAAERSGNLTAVMGHLCEMLERSEETARQVKGALMYPIVVVSVLSLSVIFLLGFVVPKFARMFERRGIELPMLTQWLMAFGQSLQTHWWVYLLVIGGLIFGVRHAWRSPKGRLLIDRGLHRVPVLRQILVGLAVGRFARILGLALGSGLNLIESLQMAGRASGRPMLMHDVDRMVRQVRTGGRLNQVMSECNYVTGFVKRMLAAGEQSGELPKMCETVARHYDRETTHITKSIATVIEPVLIVSVAGIVLIVALAIFLPLWDMVKLVG